MQMCADEFPALDMRRDVQDFERENFRGDRHGQHAGFLVRFAQRDGKKV